MHFAVGTDGSSYKKMTPSLLYKGLAVFIILYCITERHVACEEPEIHTGDDDQDDVSSYSSADKRQHNILRFGKRPSSLGHNLIRFGKRLERTDPQHSYLFLGKRGDEPRNNLPDLIRYLQKSQDNSWKRGHNIMRFGKRGENHHFIRFGKRGDNHHFIRFGKRDGVYPFDDVLDFDHRAEGYDDIHANDNGDDMKRNGHSMMYFGKRGGHSMLYFGKRGGHNMLYFGKRQNSEADYPDVEDVFPENKRGPHSMIHFGKREQVPEENILNSVEDKRSHSMIHFGKRFSEDDMLPESSDDKRAHSMIHFGKREPTVKDETALETDPKAESFEENDKRGTHSMIHFGKRNEEEGVDENLSQWVNPSGPLESNAKRYHSLLRFGKRFMDSASSRGGGHSMIHFGKREDDKRAHSMIHFGKRSVQEENNESPTEDSAKQPQASGEETHGKRQKRQVNADETPMVSLVHYVPEFSEIARQMYNGNGNFFGHQNVFSDNGFPDDKDDIPEYQVEEVPLFFTRQVRSDWRVMGNEFQSPDKKENSKNVFLRFGKR